VGAFGLAFALRANDTDAALADAHATLLATRPTAVNLRWALERVKARAQARGQHERADAAWHEAVAICDEDVACNEAIGRHGAALLAGLARKGKPLDILTHCNAGAIATVGHGTALSVVYQLVARGVDVHVWVDETRPRNQGAALTAWELRERGIAHTVVVDNAGGQLMREGRVDAVVVGCDRVAANGDVANKVGTYLKALAARDNDIPFYVACPASTIDPRAGSGEAIAIELRDAREVTHVRGRGADGVVVEVQVVPDGTAALNPAFDVTPARLVTALVTEHGRVDATVAGIRQLLLTAGAQ
jgi:methylthioribose-1-phosphate isomerase